MAAIKIAVALAFAVLSSLLLLASAIRPLSTGLEDRAGQPLESTNDTLTAAHHLDIEGFRHVDLSLRRPFRYHGGAHFFGFRIHLSVDGLRHHHRHHDGGHPAEPAEALAETDEAGEWRKMAADSEEVKERNPSFFHRHSHHLGGHRFHGGWVAQNEELRKKRKVKNMVMKIKEDSDSDSDSDAEDNNEGKEKEEKVGWLSWFKSAWSHVHRRRCRRHHRLHHGRHHLGHRSHGWMVNPEGDEKTVRPWLTAHHLEKEEDVKEILEQPKMVNEEIKSESGASEPEKEEEVKETVEEPQSLTKAVLQDVLESL